MSNTTTAPADQDEQVRRDEVRLAVQNPSPYDRRGAVVTRWAPIASATGITGPYVRVRDDDRVLASQIDILDPDDPSRTQLAFILDRPAVPGDEHYGHDSMYLSVESGTPGQPRAMAEAFPTGVKLKNDRLEVWVNTSVEKEMQGRRLFGGAITSVQFHQFEMLAALAAKHGFQHDPEKRLQVDRVRLWRPAWEAEPCQDVYLFDKPWRTIATSQGPVRACATIVSSPFEYRYHDPITRKEGVYDCALYRSLSLYADADHVNEQMWVKAMPRGGGPEPAGLWFTARYFMMVDLSPEPETLRYFNIPDWFAITASVDPYQGYGFACDVHTGALWNPPLDFPDQDTEHRAFSWELGAALTARCVHIFRLHTTPSRLADAAGWGWYDHVYKPLRARVVT